MVLWAFTSIFAHNSISMQLSISTLDELPGLCRQILPELEKNRIILFNAKMGAGKTTLIAELCRQLDCTSEASSPTYSIVNEYETKGGQIIYHFDLYRLKSAEEAMDLGFEDYVESGRICLIEWPDIAMELIHLPCLELSISLENGIRTYTLSPL